MWAYADQGSYKMSLRKVYKNWKKAKTTANKLKKINEEKFSNERLYKIFVDSIIGFDSSLVGVSEENEAVVEFE